MKTKKADNNVKKEKTKLIMGIVMMVLAVAIAGGTYAYYRTVVTGTITGTIASWDCANGSGTLTTALGNLKPGSSGSFALKVSTADLSADVTVRMKYDNTANVPANFKLYKDSGHGSSIAMSGSFAQAFSENNIGANQTKTYTVYYYWPYGTTAETPISTNTGKPLSITYEITCKQSTIYNS